MSSALTPAQGTPVPELPDPEAPANPYVGPVAFIAGQELHGRQGAARDLADLLVARRVVLLYSPSGAGKTSLIQAKLLPDLGREMAGRFRISPVLRVNHEPSAALLQTSNRYVLSLLRHLEDQRPEGDRLPDEALAPLTLARYLAERWPTASSSGRRQYDLLVLDQFEEVFTIDPAARAAKRELFRQLGEALGRSRESGEPEPEGAAPVRWALVSMREDHIAELDDFRGLVPTELATTFRLNLLSRAEASEAIRKPAERAGVTFEPVEALVEDLSRVCVRKPDGTETWEPGVFVEPVQLQVVCHQLWNKAVRKDHLIISAADLAPTGGASEVDAALQAFYDQAVRTVSKACGISDRVIRDWFERQLIAPSEVRSQVLRDPGADAKDALPPAAIDSLARAHVVRMERRSGRDWVELTHDRLIQPVLAANRAWRKRHYSLLQRQAALWDDAGGAPGYVLTGEALEKEEAWAAAHPGWLDDTDKRYLAACREARDRASQAAAARRHEDAAHRRLRRVAKVATLAIAAFLWVSLQAYVERAVTLRWATQARSTHKLRSATIDAGWAVRLADSDQARAALHATAADRSVEGVAGDEELRALKGSFQYRLGGRLAALPRPVRWALGLREVGLPPEDTVEEERLAVDAALLAAVRRTPPVTHRVDAPDGRVLAVGFAPDALVAASDKGTALQPWSSRAPAVERPVSSEITAATHDPGSGLLAVATRAGGLVVMRAGPGSLEQVRFVPVGNDGGSQVTALALAPGGDALVAARRVGATWRLASWDVTTEPATLQWSVATRHHSDIRALAFSADGARLASADWSGSVSLWSDLRRGPAGPREKELPRSRRQEAAIAIYSLAFSPTEPLLAAGTHRGTVLLWDVAGQSGPRRLVQGGHEWVVSGLAFATDGKTLASAGYDKVLVLWDVWRDEDGRPDARARRRIGGLGERIHSIAYGQGRIALGGERTLLVVDPAGRESPLVRTLPGSDAGQRWNAVALARGGELIVAGRPGEVRAWELPGGDPAGARLLPWRLAHEELRSLAVDQSGRLFATGTDAGELRLWRGSEAPEAVLLLARGAGPPGGPEGTAATCRDLPASSAEGPVRRVAFSGDGTHLAAARGRTLLLWRLVGGVVPSLVACQAMAGTIYGMAFSPTGDLLAVAGSGMPVATWHAGAAGLRLAATAAEPTKAIVLTATFASDGRSFQTGDDLGRVQEWDPLDLSAPRLVGTYERSISSIARGESAAIAPQFHGDKDGRVVARLGPDVLRHSEELLRRGDDTRSLACTGRCDRLAVAGEDVALWDLRREAMRGAAAEAASLAEAVAGPGAGFEPR